MFKVLITSFHFFISAAFLTLQLTATALLIGTIIGLVFAFLRISNNKILKSIANLYITVIRGTPLIVQVMVLYFGITNIIVLDQFWAGSLALAIHNGAYIAEIFRGSIQSVDRGQMEAARSLGMPYPLAMRRIILPQAFKQAIPPLGNQFIIGLKDSSLVAYIGMSELWGVAISEAQSTFKQLTYYSVAGLYYLVLVLIISFIVHRLENHLNTSTKKI